MEKISGSQLLIAKLNSNLEDQSESVALHLLRPKVIRDVDSLQQEIKLLQAQMAQVQKQLNLGKSIYTANLPVFTTRERDVCKHSSEVGEL